MYFSDQFDQIHPSLTWKCHNLTSLGVFFLLEAQWHDTNAPEKSRLPNKPSIDSSPHVASILHSLIPSFYFESLEFMFFFLQKMSIVIIGFICVFSLHNQFQLNFYDLLASFRWTLSFNFVFLIFMNVVSGNACFIFHRNHVSYKHHTIYILHNY